MLAHKLVVGEAEMASFDTLKYAKRAESVGFTREQAEFQAEEIAKVLDENLVTKEDLTLVSDDIKIVRLEVEKAKVELNSTIEKVKSNVEMLRVEVKSIENKIVLKLGAMLVVAVGVLATLIKLF